MIILILLILVLLLLYRFFDKSLFNPVNTFLAIWLVIFFLGEINVFSYYDISDQATAAYIFQVLFFFLGGVFAKQVATKDTKKQSNAAGNINFSNFKFRFGPFYFLAIVSIVVMAFMSLSIIARVFNGGTFWEAYKNGDVIDKNLSGAPLAVWTIIINPFCYAICPVAAYLINWGNVSHKDKKFLFVISVLDVFFHTMLHGGRSMIIVFVISFFIPLLMRWRKTEKKSKIIGLTTALITVSFMLFITAARGVNDLYEHAYLYLVGNLSHFSTLISNVSPADYTFGATSFYGVTRIFAFLLSGFNVISEYSSFYVHVTGLIDIVNVQTMISNSTSIIAHIGLSYYFYCDLGLAGVAIGNFAVAFVSVLLYKNIANNPVCGSLFLLLEYTLIQSFIRLYTIDMTFVLAFLFIALLFKKVNKRSFAYREGVLCLRR